MKRLLIAAAALSLLAVPAYANNFRFSAPAPVYHPAPMPVYRAPPTVYRAPAPVFHPVVNRPVYNRPVVNRPVFNRPVVRPIVNRPIGGHPIAGHPIIVSHPIGHPVRGGPIHPVLPIVAVIGGHSGDHHGDHRPVIDTIHRVGNLQLHIRHPHHGMHGHFNSGVWVMDPNDPVYDDSNDINDPDAVSCQ
jgi:hypothetical protein